MRRYKMNDTALQNKLEKIGKYGCYFLSLLKAFNRTSDFLELYDKYIAKGFMDSDCYLEYPKGIVVDLSGYENWKVEKTTTFKKGDIVIAYYFNPATGLHHFVLFNNDNKLVWDSLGQSNTVRNGFIESYRIFTRTN